MPTPTEFFTHADPPARVREWLPGADALRYSSIVIKEWLGLAAQAVGLASS